MKRVINMDVQTHRNKNKWVKWLKISNTKRYNQIYESGNLLVFQISLSYVHSSDCTNSNAVENISYIN